MALWNGASTATIQQQNTVAQQALQSGKISQTDYNKFKTYQDEQYALAKARESTSVSPMPSAYWESSSKAPTGYTPATTAQMSSGFTQEQQKKIATEQASRGFYNRIGFPQYGGLYAPIDLPAGAEVTDIKQDDKGNLTVSYTPPPEPEKSTPLEAALGSNLIKSGRANQPASGDLVGQLQNIGSQLGSALGFKKETPLTVVQRQVEVKRNPIGAVADTILTDVGVVSLGINPAAGLLASGIGAGISEGLNYLQTGRSLTPAELAKAGVQGAGFSTGASAAMKGASAAIKAADKSIIGSTLRSTFSKGARDVLGYAERSGATTSPIWRGMSSEVSPVFEGLAQKIAPTAGRATFMGGLGGGLGFVESGGNIEEAEKNAILGAGLSLGLDTLSSTVLGRVKSIRGKESAAVKPVEKAVITKTPLKFEEPEPVTYDDLPSALASELRHAKANRADPLYKLLFPKDAMKHAEARYGSTREVRFEETAPLTKQEGMNMMDALFPEQAQLRAIKHAEARYGDTSTGDVSSLADEIMGRGIAQRGYGERVAKWKGKAARFEASRVANPEFDLERTILGKRHGAPTLSEVINFKPDIYSSERAPNIFNYDPLEGLGIRRSKWTIRAVKAGLPKNEFIGATTSELPQSLDKYILGKVQRKAPSRAKPSEAGTVEVGSAGQAVLQMEKPKVEAKTRVRQETRAEPKIAVKQRRAFGVAEVIFSQPASKSKQGYPHRTATAAYPRIKVTTDQGAKQRQGQRLRDLNIAGELLGSSAALDLGLKQPPVEIPKQPAPQKPIERQRGGTDQTEIQKLAQAMASPNLTVLQRNIIYRKTRAVKKKPRRGKPLRTAPRKKIYLIKTVDLFAGLPRPRRNTSIKSKSKHRRKRR